MVKRVIKPSIHIVSQLHGSLGEITEDLIKGLRKRFVITEEFKESPVGFDYLLCHYFTKGIVQHESFNLFKKKILILPLDGTVLTEESIKLINAFDLVITPSLVGKEILLENKITTKIEIIPNFFKKEILYSTPLDIIPELPSDKFIFYHESTLHNRKGVEYLYQAFIKAFSDTPYVDDVCLLVKTNKFNESTISENEKLKKEAIELQSKYKYPAQIYKVSQDLKVETLQKIWNKINAYVSFAKMEGFGIPLLRMAALNKQIVTLDNKLSGYKDFLNRSNCYMSDTHIEQVTGTLAPIYEKTSKWEVPDSIDDLEYNLIKCYEDYLDNSPRTVDYHSVRHMEYEEIMEKYSAAIQSL